MIAHALKPEAVVESKVEQTVLAQPNVPVNVVADAANEAAPKRRRYGARM